MIKIKNLSFSYQKKKSPLFSDFSLELHNGHIVGLLGKNGAGKSTLLSLIAGLLKPSSGTIDVNGFKPFDRKPDFLADIYFVPEEFEFPGVSIATYVKAFAPLYPAFDNEETNEIENPRIDGFPLSSYSFIIFDVTNNDNDDNIKLLKYGPDHELKWGYQNGNASYTGQTQAFQSNGNFSGYRVFMSQVYPAIWVKDPTKVLKIVMKNPITGGTL